MTAFYFLIAAHVISRLMLGQIYPPVEIRILLHITFVLLVDLMSDFITAVSHI